MKYILPTHLDPSTSHEPSLQISWLSHPIGWNMETTHWILHNSQWSIELQEIVSFQLHPTHLVGWLQGRVAHFLRHNPIFCKLACIYMLLTWHKNINFPNLWLDLDFQLEEENMYKRNLQHIYTKYIIMDFWSWKIWAGLLFVPLYTCIFVYEFYLRYIMGTWYMIC